MSIDAARVRAELWTSWASVLRSYAAAHGLNAPQQAVLEISAESILLRVGSRWVRFEPHQVEHDHGAPQPFLLREDGTVQIAEGAPEEMDEAAERLTRGMLFPSA